MFWEKVVTGYKKWEEKICVAISLAKVYLRDR